MLQLPISKTLADNIIHGKQNLIVTDHDCDDAGNLITLVNESNNKPLVYVSLDSCTCDVAKNLFDKLKTVIHDFTEADFKRVTKNSKIAYVLKVSQPQLV